MEIPIVITHFVKPQTYCPDGAAAAWVVAKAYNFNVEVHGEVYRQEKDWERMYQYSGGSLLMLPYDPRDRDIILVDWAGYPVELMVLLQRHAKSITILDHHKTRVEDLNQLGSLSNLYYGYVPTELGCGASIAWNYYFPLDDPPWFIKYVRSRDTNRGGFWQGKLPEHEAVNFAIGNLRKGIKSQTDLFTVFDYLYTIAEWELDIDAGVKQVDFKNEVCWDEVRRWELDPSYIELNDAYGYLVRGDLSDLQKPDHIDLSVPCCQIVNPSADRFYSWVGTYLSEVNPDAPFVVIKTSQGGNDLSVHLRKPLASDADCGAIARYFGGGGHADAAGFPLT